MTDQAIADLCVLATYLLLLGTVFFVLRSRAGAVFEWPWRWQARRARKRYERECAARGVQP